jgi:hypothetical protein
VTAEPLHARVAGFLERAFNPILVKELRGSLRGGRFFLAHGVVLGLFAAVLLATLGVLMAEARQAGDAGIFRDPADLGRIVYVVTQVLHVGVVLLVVPGLAATSLTIERERLTHDLLVTTSLGARSIVWGKFSAALVQTFTILVSMLPLVALTFLFGGVTVYQIAANYVFLLGLAAVVVAFSLLVSSHAASTPWAIALVYGLTFLGGWLAGIAGAVVADQRGDLAEAAAVGYGFLSPGAWGGGRTSTSLFDRLLYVHAVPGYLAATLAAFSFLGATNRLKPLYADRSTSMRIFAVVALAGLLALGMTAIHHETAADASARERAETLMGAAVGALVLALVTATLACDDGATPAHLARGGRGPLALLRPGCEPGTAFAAALAVACAAAVFAALLPLTRGFDRGAWSGLPAVFPWALACAAVAAWGVVCALYGRWLTWVFPGRPVLVRTLLVAGALLLAVAPVLHWAVAQEIDRDEGDPGRLRGPATLLASPVAAVLSALDLSTNRRDFPMTAMGVPIPAALLVLGRRAKRRATSP